MPSVQNIDVLLNCLIGEHPGHEKLIFPPDLVEKRRLIRSLMNGRPAQEASKSFLKSQDAELKKQLLEKGIVDLNQTLVSHIDKRLRLWQGDITRLKVDTIVNAANSQMLGCFIPMHGCIDNAIHSAAGIQMRFECNELMKKQGHPEPTGSAKITRGYNLPAKFVIHTVGPIIGNSTVTQLEQNQLTDCYHSCLRLADDYKLKSIAFCCISTGEYRFPNQLAAEIATSKVRKYFDLSPATGIETVVFNVFKDFDFSFYSKILKCSQI